MNVPSKDLKDLTNDTRGFIFYFLNFIPIFYQACQECNGCKMEKTRSAQPFSQGDQTLSHKNALEMCH